MSDIVNISIEVQDQIAVSFATAGLQGPIGPATTDASLLTSGELPDARLSDNVVLVSALLAALSEQITINSNGPPLFGAVPQDDGSGSFVWSATAIQFFQPNGVDIYLQPNGIDTYYGYQ